MTKTTGVLLKGALFCAALGLFPQAVAAHPHAWIDMRTTILIDAAHRITAIEEHWLFDEFYTDFALHDFDGGNRTKLAPDVLIKLADDNLKNLKPFDYFTALVEGGKKRAHPVKDVTNVKSVLEGKRIALDFTVELAAPAAITPDTRVMIYDPSYYISMEQEKKIPIALSGPGAQGCKAEMHTPHPTLSQIASAASVDSSGMLPDGLGDVFAQRISISCTPSK